MRFLTSLIFSLIFVLGVSKNGSAASDNIIHYVKTTEQLSIRDGKRIPVGSIVSVRYDAGDGWITYSESVYPKINKSAAVLLEGTVYDPPIDGTANQLTTTYQLAQYNTALLFAYALKPSSDGTVIAKGESVKIIQRVGDYFFVSTSNVRAALIPASTITVAAGVLSSGKIIPVPAVPAEGTAATTNRSPPHAGHLYGKLKVPFTLEGKVIPVGGYVEIAYDAGDKWSLSNSDANAAKISKAAVDLVDRVDFFTPLTGKMKVSAQLFVFQPDLRKDPTTLRQSQLFANLNPTSQGGDTLTITAREGDDYIVQLNQPPGRMRQPARAPVSYVDITYGNPATGSPVFIAPLPHVAPPPKPQAPEDTLALYGVPFVLISLGTGIAGWIARKAANASTVKPGEADYGVPHARFIPTDDGFRVTFMRSSEAFYRTTHFRPGQTTGFAAILMLVLMLVFIMLLILWAGIESFFKTVITVDREFVTINGKRFPRSDFGGFNVDHTLSGDAGQVAVLGYSFGRRTFPFGGVWDDGLAQEVASALNSHLRYVKSAANEQRASPEMLRTARPTDF